MAIPLGKLSLIVGAGLVGSALAKEGRVSNTTDFFSSAFKIVLKQLQQVNSTASLPKPRNDSLIHQVNSLREELQFLASSRSVTIVTGDRSASGKYGVIVILVGVGYGYIWWKGYKLTDMMFTTRRGLNDACSSVAKQLETVHDSISVTKKHLSSRIDRVDCKLDECADNSAVTKNDVSALLGDVKLIGSDVRSTIHVLRSLETKICRIDYRQIKLNSRVGILLESAQNIESSRSMAQIEGDASSSSRLALEMPRLSPSETSETADDVGVSDLTSPLSSNGIRASEETNIESSSSGLLGQFLGLLTRSRSVVSSTK